MKKAMIYILAFTLAFSTLLTGCGEIRGRDDKTVSFFEPGSDLIHPVIENAFPRIGAAPARDASAYRLVADLYDFSLNALRFECLHKLITCYGGIASYRRTSVEYQYFHYLFSPILSNYYKLIPPVTGYKCFVNVVGTVMHAQKNRKPLKDLRSDVGCRTRIRTLTSGVRGRCATVTPFGNAFCN